MSNAIYFFLTKTALEKKRFFKIINSIINSPNKKTNYDYFIKKIV